MKGKTIAAVLLGLFVQLPISIYIMYTLLLNAGVDRLVWFLFIINIPVTIFAKTLIELGDST